VAFLDADDRLLPGAIQSGLECFRNHPDSAFVFGAYRNIYDDGSPAPTDLNAHVERDHYWHLLQGNIIGMHSTVLYSRAVLESVGGFNAGLRACEDYELYLRVSRRWSISQHGELIAEYRQHDTNMSRDYVLMLKSVLSVLQAERRHVPDRRHRSALRTGMRVWRDYYGDLLIGAWRMHQTRSTLLKVLRWHPRGIAKRAANSFRRRLGRWSQPGRIRFGSLRRLSPVSRQFGFDRGTPIDRHYIEKFLNQFAACVQGHVLEVGDDFYSRKFGNGRVTRQDVIHVVPGTPGATIIADLTDAPDIPSEQFDCIILTQTLHFIYDLQTALSTVARILKPGGALLVTLPGISQVCRDQLDLESDSWRFTRSSAHRLFHQHFPAADLHVQTYGNVLAATAFLYGLATSDLNTNELDHHDPDYPVTIGVRVVKAKHL
jgi:hypothetical protein